MTGIILCNIINLPFYLMLYKEKKIHTLGILTMLDSKNIGGKRKQPNRAINFFYPSKQFQPFQKHFLLTDEHGCPLHTFLKERLSESDIACVCYTTSCNLSVTLSFSSTMGENNHIFHNYNEIL